MDGLTLLRQAREAGLAVRAHGENLVIRGPKRAELLARLLLENKSKVLIALDRPSEEGQWSDRYASRIAHWFRGDRRWFEAKSIAYGEMLLEWHLHHGSRSSSRRCSGCEGELQGDGRLVLIDGAALHFDSAHGVDCLIAYGQKWRSAAVAGLCALGLHPPQNFTLL